MTADAHSARRLQRLEQILAESKTTPTASSLHDPDPARGHLSDVPLERIVRLTSELREGAETDGDDIDRLATRLLLTAYAVAVAHLRAVARLAEQRIAAATTPIEETRLRIRRRDKAAARARRETI